MPTVSLPDEPSLEQLRKQAKSVRDLSRDGVPGALALVAEHHPQGAHAVSLAGAQLVVARHYGFGSWARLKHHVETINRLRRDPDEVDTAATPADEFLLLACLRYGGDDSPTRWRRAARILKANPTITATSIHAAAAAADLDALTGILDRDPAAASREGGPYAWEPLMYLAYARHNPKQRETDTVASVKVLVDHGADPNVGYLWHGLLTPFTALTGAFGSGEGAPPAHANCLALARALLEAGADANDGQVLYNRGFGDDDSHLKLLLEFGLGHGDGGPWRKRLDFRPESPHELLHNAVWSAIIRDQRDRLRLLVEHGADFLTPYQTVNGRPSAYRTSDGKTAAEVAALSGCTEIVEYLVSQGAARPRKVGVDGFIGAVMANDELIVERLMKHAAAAREQRPGLAVWALARGNPTAMWRLLDLGWDINTKARTDIPMEQQWETLLHEAASRGDVDLARQLLERGADPTIEDSRFHATPRGWAEHFEQTAMAEFLGNH